MSASRYVTMEFADAVQNGVLSQFSDLSKALIDASSMIYMEKAGFLAEVAAAITLAAPKEILDETGFETIAVHAIAMNPKAVSNDEKLIGCALALNLPVISDDRKVLLQLARGKIPFFNALMMLNYLLFKGDISFESHSAFFQRLRGFSRYSDQVLAFSKDVYWHIVNQPERIAL